MPKILGRGRTLYDAKPSETEPHLTIITMRLWAVAETGETYSKLVDISVPTELEVATDADIKAIENMINRENQQILNEELARFPPGESFDLPKETKWKELGLHSEGECPCGLTHPPHLPWQVEGEAPTCWCGKKHQGAPPEKHENGVGHWPQNSERGTTCWCRKDHGPHSYLGLTTCWCGEYNDYIGMPR